MPFLGGNTLTRSNIASLSPWSLQISQVQIQAAFISYIRRAVRKNTDIFLSLQLVIGLLFLALSCSDLNNKNNYRQIGITLVFPALLNLTLSLISRKLPEYSAEKMTELITPVNMIGTSLCFVVINLGFVTEHVT